MARERMRFAKPKEVSASAAPALVTLADSAAAVFPSNSRTSTSRSQQNKGTSDLERLLAARKIVAMLVLHDPVYGPIFKRLEDEIAAEEAALSQDVVTRARAILRQSASGVSNS